MRRVHPEPGCEVTAAEAYAVPRRRTPRRPWIGVCMVATLDGSTVVAGRSGAISNPNDTDVLLTLRAAADLIIVGATTARHESYGAPRKSGQRIGVVTATGRVDASAGLFRGGAGFLIMPEDGPPPPGSIDVVRAGTGRVDLALAVARLGEVGPEPTFVQAEGGPTLNGALLDADCVDELDLTVSPVMAGGSGPRLTAGAGEVPRRFELAHVLVDEHSFVFTRWLRRHPIPS